MYNYDMNQATDNYYPIRAVSEQTGVNAVTLRAWERRYGLIKPSRTPKGHRLYSDADIALITEVCERLNQGISISRIANDINNRTNRSESEESDVWDSYLNAMISGIQQFDENTLDTVYNEANAIYPVDVVTNRLIVPLLKMIGDRWSDKTGSVAEEHFFSVYLRNKLGARFHHQNGVNRGHRLIAACLPGEHHEFGLLLFALSAHSRGYRMILLGADMPIEELAHVAATIECEGIVLTGSASLNCKAIKSDMKALSAATEVPVFIGGDVIDQCADIISSTRMHSIGTDITTGISIISNKLDS